MTMQDVINLFDLRDADDLIVLPNKATVRAEVFAGLFKGAPTNLTYDELVAIDKGVMGYIPFFDDLKEKGILN